MLPSKFCEGIVTAAHTTNAEHAWKAGHDGGVGRSTIDGCVVIYDLDDVPVWLKVVQDHCDEDGNTNLNIVEVVNHYTTVKHYE